MNVLATVIFFAEVLLLAFADKRIWKSLVTPLNCLMLPYAVVVLICIGLSDRMDYPPFNFSILWVYAVGLLLFFIPSCFFGILYNRRKDVPTEFVPLVSIPEKSTLKTLEWLTVFVFVLFLGWFLWLAFTFPAKIGSDTFGERFASRGFFGHLVNLFMVLGIIWIYLFDFKQHKRYGIYILGFVLTMLIYQVKGWLFIPVLGALCLRVLTGRTKGSWKMILLTVSGAFVAFFVFYWVDMYVAGAETYMELSGFTRAQYARSVFHYINRHFLSYLTAGVYGFSQDMTLGILEDGNPEKIFTPFVNLFNFLAGKPLVSHLNDIFVSCGFENTNVRSFMGTLYVFLGGWGAAGFMLVYSCVVNAAFFVAKCRRNFFLWIYIAWTLGRLVLGWFDPYVQTLTTIEIPLILCGLALYTRCWKK